jgi:hypothetical protein
MTELGLSELTVAIANWCGRIGETHLADRPDLTELRTSPFGDYGELLVRINAHKVEIDGIPPFHIVIHPADNLLAFMVMVNPYTGTVINGFPGLEDHLIAHFNALGVQ